MHSLHAALTSTALLALVLIPVALYLAKRLRPFVCAVEAHLYLCLAALPPVLAACYALGLPSRSRPWLLLALALLAVVQIGSVRLAVLVLHRLFLLLAALALWGTLATILLLITRSQARDQQANFAQLSRVAPEMTREHLEGAIVLFAVGLDDRDRTTEVCAALTGALEKTRSRAAYEALRGERP